MKPPCLSATCILNVQLSEILEMKSLSMVISGIIPTIDKKKSKPDHLALSWFQKYLDFSNFTGKPSHFGATEFKKYLNWLRENKPYKAVYTQSVAVRRICIELQTDELSNVKFADRAEYWSAPEKPTPTHFKVLEQPKRDTLQKYLKEEIALIFEKERIVQLALKSGKLINETGADFFRKSEGNKFFYTWQESLNNVLYTLYTAFPEFPGSIDIDETLPGRCYGRVKNVKSEEMYNTFITIYKRMGIQKLKNASSFLPEFPNLSFNELLNYLYPGFSEAYCIRWAIELEAAWTPDIVKNINSNDYEISIPNSSSTTTLIHSTKCKGQQSESAIGVTDKSLVWPSNKDNQNSAINLIKLWIRRTSRLRKGIHYEKIVEQIGTDPFLIYLNDYSNFNKTKSTMIAMHPKAIGAECSTTRKRYQLNVLGFDFDERQLKPTSLYLTEKNKSLSPIMQVALLGHSDSSITDEFYKDDAHFQQIRKERLAKELNAIESSIKDNSFRATLVPRRSEKTLQDQIITIFTEHAGESPLSVCKDPYQPDWSPDSHIDTPCHMFNKCLNCSQATVFEDNIPFIVDRYLYLQNQRSNLAENVFARLYGDEFIASKEIIESWPYQDQIQEAMDRTFIEGYLLPPVISESFMG